MMEIDSAEEDNNRWGKSPIHSNHDDESHSPSQPSIKKKKKRSKKKKKHKRSKSKKKKSNKDDRWDPTHIASPKPDDTASNTSPTRDSRSKTPPKTKRSKSPPTQSRSRSRSHPRSNSVEHSKENGRNKRYNDGDRRYYRDRTRYRSKHTRDHFTDSPPRYYGMERYRGKEQRINHKVIAALNEIQEKHKDDNKHPLDLKQQELKRNCARKKDKAMIWAAASGHFETEIMKSPQFQKNISLALKTTNKDFDIAVLFKQFSNYSVKLVWLDCSDRESGIKKSELLTFRDLMSIRSYRKELNHCDALWKFIFYDQRHLFWSMAIYYALIGTTLVPEWDAMFKKQFDLIGKYGKMDYIQKDIELLDEKRRNRSRSRDKYRSSRDRDNDNDSM